MFPLPSRRTVFGLLAAAASVLLASGLILGEVAHLEPCYLCNFQRLLYIVIALLALCASLINRWPRVWGVLIAAAALWGVASAYSVLLFIILMTFGYFYVRALTASERRGAGA